MHEDQPGLPAPRLSADDAASLARTVFGVEIEGTLRALGSQQDLNYALRTVDGTEHVLKVSNPGTTREELVAQHVVMERLGAAGVAAPAPAPTADGDGVAAVDLDGVPHLVRLLTYLPGTPMSRVAHLPDRTLAEVGGLASAVSRALEGASHPGLERDFQWDLRRGADVVDALARHVRDDARRTAVTAAAADVRRRLAGLDGGAGLPVQAVHGDLTDDNVVVGRDTDGRLGIDGVIDLGDASYGWRVAELAVACTTAFHRAPDEPLAVLPMAAAFDAAQPLTDGEVEALWPLVVLRGAVLVVSGEQQVAVDPANDYAREGLAREWLSFATAASVDPAVAHTAVRRALGRHVAPPTVPSGAHPLLGDLRPVPVDLSPASRELRDGAWVRDPAGSEVALLRRTADAHGAATTRFAEARLTRSRLHDPRPPRNVALAVDVVVVPGTGLTAPLDGELRWDDGLWLHTATHTLLVEGVDPSSLTAGPVRAGEPLGRAGGPLRVWLAATPALRVRPPLAVSAAEAPAWRATLVDPSALLGVETVPAPPAVDELARRTRAYDPLQAHYYDDPPQVERGWREHLVDTAGRHYVDMVNNVTVLGHAHPAMAEVAADQWSMLNTNSRFHYRALADLGERLLATLPDAFDSVLLVNSGTEAVDLALRLTKAWSGRQDVLCVSESYHGWSLAADAVSTSESDNPLAAGTRAPWVHVTETPNAYRGTHRGPEAGAAYARDAIALLRSLEAAGTPVGTFVTEPRQGNAGAVEVPPGYLAAVFAAVRAGGGLCISDEVQVGYGRQGDVFWGFEQHPGVVPDVVTVAKAMGNGHPLGAVLTRREVTRALADQGTFFSSAGGSTLSCRIGSAVLDVIGAEGLQENARAVGAVLSHGFARLAVRHPLVGAVHGRGLYQGVELVRDRDTREPAVAETRAVCERMRELGVVVQPTGDRQNILKAKPPLCLTADSARHVVAMLDEVLTHGW